MWARKYAIASMLLGFLAGTAPTEEVRGTLTKIDAEKKELVVDNRGSGKRGTAMTFVIDKDTPVLFGSTPGNVGDLTVGKRVRISYDVKDGKNVVTAVYPSGLTPAAVARGEDKPGTGTIKTIVLEDKKITVISRIKDGKEMETSYSIPESAKITRSDKKVKLDELKAGERVAVETEKQADKLVVKAIQILPPDPSDIQRVRGALKELDFFLQMLELKQATKKP